MSDTPDPAVEETEDLDSPYSQQNREDERREDAPVDEEPAE